MKEITLAKQKIYIYTDEEIEKMKLAGNLAAKTLEYIKDFVKEGVSTNFLDTLCGGFIVKNGGIPACLNYNGYPKNTCISINHVICHGIPNDDKLLYTGDILNIDVTVIIDGYYGDTSKMYTVGDVSTKAKKLISVTRECLNKAIEILKPGIDLNEIGKVIEEIAHKNNFSVVEDFCGHGTGTVFHADPNVLHFKHKSQGIILQKGMVFTIEPMINAGKKETKLLQNGWTAVTRDKSLSAQFEHTVTITENGYNILTV